LPPKAVLSCEIKEPAVKSSKAKKIAAKTLMRDDHNDHRNELFTMGPANALAFLDDFFGVLNGSSHKKFSFLLLALLMESVLPTMRAVLIKFEATGVVLALAHGIIP
jgi:hypothetical protein